MSLFTYMLDHIFKLFGKKWIVLFLQLTSMFISSWLKHQQDSGRDRVKGLIIWSNHIPANYDMRCFYVYNIVVIGIMYFQGIE